jgi:hypothetical protein
MRAAFAAQIFFQSVQPRRSQAVCVGVPITLINVARQS